MSQVQITQACRHDASDIADLARAELPDMTFLHDAESWVSYARFGPGRHPRDKFALVVREGDDGELLGFFWVDDAPAEDHGIAEPWWCINAVAVRADIQRRGLGSTLVDIIVERATDCGVNLLYGLCYPSAAAFWSSRGFEVGAMDQDLQSSGPVRFLDGSRRQIGTWGCEPGNHLFVRNLREHADARLQFGAP